MRPGRVTMAAVTEPEYSFSPAPVRPRRRRWVLTAVIAVWVVVLGGLAIWSVKHDPATVPEQRDIRQALPELQQAVGVVFAAAGGPGRAVVLGPLETAERCRVTPVREGVVAGRDVIVYVRSGSARVDVEAIAAALPKGYRAEVSVGRAGTRFAFHADAGNFVGIDATSDAEAQVVTLRASSGCRPTVSGPLDQADPHAGAAPAALGAVLAAVGAPVGSAATVQSVACADGGTAGTYSVDGIAEPRDLAGSLRGVMSGASVIWSDPAGWAYRTGNDSVVITADGGRLRVSASTAC
jgi:hypothetical protein